ncbi:hypothetical protein FNV43_RR02448 [Rhamnella rubrinervis]|uniref:Uncharacterized protein n=1 Tax=Rhamnella rubrinervis TaxID=2594499 RepID=A0A8K0MTQ4_9ROSA|nr:hypothetical protein FNV43_RR02448 [Rhamnella rubrinervis]
MVPTVHEMPLLDTIHYNGGWRTTNIALIVEDRPDIYPATNKVYSIANKIGVPARDAKKIDAVKRGIRHSSPSIYTLQHISHCPLHLESMRLRLMDTVYILHQLYVLILSRLSSMENEGEGERIVVCDNHKMDDQRIDHAANHLVPPMSISSSPIVEFEHPQFGDKYPEVFDPHVLLLDNRLSI